MEDESQTVSYKVFIAEYEPLEKVKAATVPGEPVPDGYVAVTFEKGEKGESLEGTSRFFVLKNVPINLTGYTPVIKAKKGFKFIGWDNNLLFVATTEKLFRAQYEVFGQRRKTLLNSLNEAFGTDKDSLRRILQNADIAPHRRAETLDIDDFTRLTDEMIKAGEV